MVREYSYPDELVAATHRKDCADWSWPHFGFGFDHVYLVRIDCAMRMVKNSCDSIQRHDSVYSLLPAAGFDPQRSMECLNCEFVD